MGVNKNALHEIVMTYIPTKKNSNETQPKKMMPTPTPAAIFKGPIPTLNKSSLVVEKVQNNLVKTQPIILSKESPKITNHSLLSDINIEQNIKKIKKKKLIEPLHKSIVERFIEQKEKTNFIHNLISKSEPNSRKISPRSNMRINSRKQRNYMKKNIIDTKIFEPDQNNKSFRDFTIKLDSSRKRGGSKKKSSKKSKKGSKKGSKKTSIKNSIKIKNNVPMHLRHDLERLLNDDDHIILQRIKS